MDQQNIVFISFGQFGKVFLDNMAEAVRYEFGYPALVHDAHADLSEFYDPSRRQYNGDKLLKVVHSMNFPGSIKAVGLFTFDLFIPILTYVFGQAYLGGRTAIASVYRLKNERYGMIADEKLLLDRFTKVVIHELGHTFGLKHCHVPVCVMRSGTYVEDIDQKESHLCPGCRYLIDSILM
jgi:archaemetzincin